MIYVLVYLMTEALPCEITLTYSVIKAGRVDEGHRVLLLFALVASVVLIFF